MGAHEVTESTSATARADGLLARLGGGDRRGIAGPDQRSARIVAGAVVLLGAGFAWLVATAAVSQSGHWPVPAVLPLTLLFGVLVGSVTRATAGTSRSGVTGRAAVAVVVGAVVGELAALAVFSGAIDHRLAEQALRNADSTPAVLQASAHLQQAKDARAALDAAVAQARERQDRALVVARCEYHPTPGCPQTRITGVPGSGPETRTADELLADAQHELDDALVAREQRAPEVDATIAREERARTDARTVTGGDVGLGGRWLAMNDVTLASPGALTLRLATIAACALLYLLPLILGLWRGQTTDDRRASARVERERADLEADTAIAVKRAEIRREAEILWAEHQLTQARLAIEAQLEIDREQQRRRVQETLDQPILASAQRRFEPVDEEVFLPIAAAAEAASRAVTQPPVRADTAEAELVPAQVHSPAAPHGEGGTSLIPSVPDATKAAARWIRPLVPTFVARVIDTTTRPLRTVFEEAEEITFSLKRTRRVSVDTESAGVPTSPTGRMAPTAGRRHPPPGEAPAEGVGRRSLESAEREGRPELVEREGRRRLSAPDGPRQLPPAQ